MDAAMCFAKKNENTPTPYLDFVEAAEWADKTMIDKACDILWAMLYEQDYNDVVNVSSWEYDNLEDFMLAFRRKLEE
jgi:hypothetical protein